MAVSRSHLSRGLLAGVLAGLVVFYARRQANRTTIQGIAASCRICDKVNPYLAPELDAYRIHENGATSFAVSFDCDDCGMDNQATLPFEVWQTLIDFGATESEDVFVKMPNAVTFDEVHDTDVETLVKRLSDS